MDEKKYQKKLIANDQQGLALISALLNSCKVKVSDMKYLHQIKYFCYLLEDQILKMTRIPKRLIRFVVLIMFQK